MCETCGCGEPGKDGIRIVKPEDIEHEHAHEQGLAHDHGTITHVHAHTHGHGHMHTHEHTHREDHHHHDVHEHEDKHIRIKEVQVELDILQRNNLMAERNRGFFEARHICAFNLVSSPGSGKTTLLEKTIMALKDRMGIAVIEGDQQTVNDAMRINATGVPVVQINTGNGCHLDAEMIRKALGELNPDMDSLLFIENVGNLVCPALFDLGEAYRVVIVSVTEGEDKPLKYPNMFQSSALCIIHKTDLLPYVDFDVDKFRSFALRVNNKLEFLEISSRTGTGLEAWVKWIEQHRTK
jgi:hydrogenase nickel incorporation protein HypB